ncbi:glycosyltransferase [Bacillus alkalicellulosilyticus]|uniref:glycosyltransferase n=1 Tax=Alkalihalobacterium alkalicellulosilyticum TaxID=1912214 RepID=UPI0009967DDC|nr:glycosyltransferase [Bacillus alkalicellulosilyticus]
MKNPKVSIIMGIYNCEKTLEESISSLLTQTYSDWELIMCDDGSTDSTLQVAMSFAQRYPNIIVIKNESNKGLAHSLNQCLQFATGEYIARQDADDRSRPKRIQKEVDWLDRQPQYDIVSTGMAFFDEKGCWGEILSVEEPQPKDFIKQSPFCHAPCMVRKEAILAVNGYDESKKTLQVEDYHLWFMMYAQGSKGYNIQEALYDVRDDRNANKRRTFRRRLNEAYVRASGYYKLKLPIPAYLFAFRPLVVGLVPLRVYNQLRKLRYKHT